MNQDRVLKIIKGLNRFSPDDIELMSGLEEDKINSLLEKFFEDGLITRFSESEYGYINKIPERRLLFRLVKKPEIKLNPNCNITFKQAAEYFLDNYVRQNCTPSTYKTYKSSIRHHLNPFFGKMILKSITQKHLENFIEFKIKEKISDKNIRNCVTLLGTMFNRFLEWGFISQSPYNGVINIKASKRENVRVLNKAKTKSLKRKAKNKSLVLYQFIIIALSTGAKRSEIFALKKEDIDLKNRKIKLNKTLYLGKIIKPRAKTATREVDIPENIICVIEPLLKDKQDNDFIFYDTKICYYTQDKRLRGSFAAIIKQLKLDRFAFDELRHTYAYNALQQGVSIDYLHKQLGEYSIQATMDKYRDFIL